MTEICTGPVLFNFLWIGNSLNICLFPLIVVKLYSYKDSDVENLRKFGYFYDYLRYSRNAWNTIQLAIFDYLDQLWK